MLVGCVGQKCSNISNFVKFNYILFLKGKSPFLNLTCYMSSTNSLQESNEIANLEVLSVLYLHAIIQLSLERGKTWGWAWVQAWDALFYRQESGD